MSIVMLGSPVSDSAAGCSTQASSYFFVSTMTCCSVHPTAIVARRTGIDSEAPPRPRHKIIQPFSITTVPYLRRVEYFVWVVRQANPKFGCSVFFIVLLLCFLLAFFCFSLTAKQDTMNIWMCFKSRGCLLPKEGVMLQSIEYVVILLRRWSSDVGAADKNSA